jgi:uncharacterized protein
VRVWIDCTAAAHPLVLRPIIERLEAGGHDVEVTARAYGQTEGVLDRLGIPYASIGRHGGAATPAKAWALASRSAALGRWARPRGFDLALGHGSVDLAVVSTMLRIPSVQMQDYEHAGLQRQLAFRAARRVLAPDAIPVKAMRRAGAAERKLFRYPGLKEDYYLADFTPDPASLDALGVERDRVVVIVRPPPDVSLYHRTANKLFPAVLAALGRRDDIHAVVIPRTEAQRTMVRALRLPSVIVPDATVDAQSLIALADLVVSAGGTMNREAVALGTPVYTTFGGRLGGVDELLIRQGRLRPLTEPRALDLVKRAVPASERVRRDPSLLAGMLLEAAA